MPPPQPALACGSGVSGLSGQTSSLRLLNDASPTVGASGGTVAPSDVAAGDQTATHKITFQDDILPILSSTETGKVYKCTVCHAAYRTNPQYLRQGDNFDQLIDAVQTQSMPLVGDPLPEAAIEIFKKWKEAGFPVDQSDPGVLAAASAPDLTSQQSPASPANDASQSNLPAGSQNAAATAANSPSLTSKQCASN